MISYPSLHISMAVGSSTAHTVTAHDAFLLTSSLPERNKPIKGANPSDVRN